MRTLCILLTACALHQVVALNELTESYCSVSLALQLHTSPVGQAGHIYEVLCENIHERIPCPGWRLVGRRRYQKSSAGFASWILMSISWMKQASSNP